FERLARVRGLQNFLRLHSVFAALPTDALARIAEEFEPVEVAAGEIVIHQGDEPGPMYVVEEGRLRAFAEHNGQLADTEDLRKGDFFGEFSVFRAPPRAATVEALTSCRLLVLPAEAFRHLLDEFPEFREKVEQRVEQGDFRKVARVPLDFAEEI